ncbi:expressed unknown protein [Seminavis robusta]|uniref:Uncharacterized protein n=1 Tax=Seminavis robusta TaxID=568900 RepID=A0A9N8DB39_9STRA|nr:expressed unknown protein [Seminavis robusta]|eukprot:Sro41_g025200.1 n/a (327) ;mRNA; r:80845-81908
MEKDDKIRDQQEKTKKYGILMVIGFVVVCGMHSMKGRQGAIVVPPPTDSTSIRRETVETPMIPEKPAATAPAVRDLRADLGALETLERRVHLLDEEVRAIKKTGVIMETDPTSLQKTGELKDLTRNLLKLKYGDHPAYRVKVDLEFQPSIPDFAEKGPDGTIVIEMAPIEYQPVSVYNFLEIARTWIRGSFHRNAGHVLQVMTVSGITKHLPFQEYSKEFPHKKGTAGYCGRPSGPCWYVSIMDNTINHGPGSQQQKNPYEADANFGTIVQGMEDVVPRIHTVPQKGWLDQQNQVKIIRKTVLIPDGQGGFKPWVDWTQDAKKAIQ